MAADNTRNPGIVFLRALATAFVVACHLVKMSNITVVRNLGHFLDVGVQLFLIISAFLYGQRGIEKSYSVWFGQRLKRLLVPMYTLLFIAIIGNICIGMRVQAKEVLSYIFNIQGLTQEYILGASHLWYLSIAMICYILTPLMERYRDVVAKNLFLIGGGGVLLQILTAYCWSERYAGYLILIFLYILAYIVGCFWKNIEIDIKTLLAGLFAIVVAVVCRLVGRILYDGSVLYNVFIAGYTHAMLAFGIFFAVAYINKRIEGKKIPAIVKWIDLYSYEIYLVHYLFCTGPFYLEITDIVAVNWFLIIVATIIAAVLLKAICGQIRRLIECI